MIATELSNRNHIKLSHLHIGLASAYAVLFGSMYFYKLGGLTESGRFAVNGLSIAMPLLHFSLAWGCKNQSEFSRKSSQFVGLLLLFFVPIGTIIGFYIIQLADWKTLRKQKIYLALAIKTQDSLNKIGISPQLRQRYGIVISLISPLTLVLIFADAGFGFHFFPSGVVMLAHYLAAFGILMLTPIGLFLFFMGRWLDSGKSENFYS